MSVLTNLSGREFYWSILSGSKRIIEHQEEINSINVFPVPDGDTGSNMSATATAVIYNATETDDLNTVAQSIGDAALDGARGNSGVIFAQFLYGIGVEIKDTATLTTKKFGEIVKKASDYVYQSIPSPREGTILTIIREWAAAIDKNKDKTDDFNELLEIGDGAAQKALERTPDQLEALKLANVVDAGAKGFVLFLEGMLETVKKRAFSRDDHDMENLLSESHDEPMAEAETLTEDSLHNRYCTETCIIGDNIPRQKVLDILEENGDSIVLAGSEKKLRIHFHTNQPPDVFRRLQEFGTFTFQKVEDMRLQYEITHKRKANIALVIDSGVSISRAFMDENQVHFVPASIIVNGTSYLDGRTITPEIFLDDLANKKNKCSTAQASPKSYADLFGYLSNYYDSIILISMGTGVSGSYNSALQGVQLAKSKKESLKVDVIDSANLGAGAGILAYYAAQDITDGKPHDDIIKNIYENMENRTDYIDFSTVDPIIRSGRLSKVKGGFIKALNLSPVLQMQNGKPVIVDKGVGLKKAMDKTISLIKAEYKAAVESGKRIKGYSLTHTFVDEKLLNKFLEKLEHILGVPAVDVSIANTVILNNVGKNGLNIGLVYES